MRPRARAAVTRALPDIAGGTGDGDTNILLFPWHPADPLDFVSGTHWGGSIRPCRARPSDRPGNRNGFKITEAALRDRDPGFIVTPTYRAAVDDPAPTPDPTPDPDPTGGSSAGTTSSTGTMSGDPTPPNDPPGDTPPDWPFPPYWPLPPYWPYPPTPPGGTWPPPTGLRTGPRQGRAQDGQGRTTRATPSRPDGRLPLDGHRPPDGPGPRTSHLPSRRRAATLTEMPPGWRHYGQRPLRGRPVASGKPSMRFMLWIAWLAAPFPRLSSAPIATAMPVWAS